MFLKKYSVNTIEIICLTLLASTGVILIGLQIKLFGWLFLIAGLITLWYCRKKFAKELLLVYISMVLLAITQITTDISYVHMFEMGATLIMAVSIPYFVSRYIYKDRLVRFQFHHGRKWYKKEILYVLTTAIISYFLLPFYLKNTGAYLNWSVEPGLDNIIRLFIGTNALGIWDELFFVSTVLGILRRFLPFSWANFLQSILFTSFLYELGFTGWGFIMIFIFALIQGVVFKKTESLLYVITIHLTLDFILFLSLIEAHHPTWMPIFIT